MAETRDIPWMRREAGEGYQLCGSPDNESCLPLPRVHLMGSFALETDAAWGVDSQLSPRASSLSICALSRATSWARFFRRRLARDKRTA